MLNIAHSFINIFAGGRSDIKVILFILYFVILITLYLLFKNYSFKVLKLKYLSITLFSMYLYGFFLHIFYILSNNIPITNLIITGNNGEISSSIIWHTHIAKGVLGQILSFFGKTQLQTMDAGGAYIGIIPSIVFLFGSILFIILLIEALYYFATSFRLLISDKNKRQKIFSIIGYSIISFSLIKTSIDGGIFNHNFIISLIFIYLFILKEKGKIIINFYYSIIFLGIILLFTSFYLDYYTYINSLNIISIATLFLLYTLLLYSTENKIQWKFLIVFLILFMSAWWVTSARDRDIYNYSKIMLENKQQIYTYNEKEESVNLTKIEKPQSISQLSKSLNKNITYVPITVPGVTCMSKAFPYKFHITLLSPELISQNIFNPSNYIKIRNENSIAKGKNWQTKLTVSIDPCLPEPLSVLNGELQKNKIYTYLLVNPLFYDPINNY